LFSVLIQTESRDEVMLGYLLGGGLTVSAAVVEAFLGVNLEEVTPPLSAA